ncbi:MAG: CPBP family intramembrane metalloprotease [Propionibacteriales bacterium]|nr:CPBP family intramembrane metalloprotease [Propionibacteriales bacterium]
MAWSLARMVRYEPAPGVEYPQSLRITDPSFTGLRQVMLGVGGAMLGLLLLLTVPGMVSLLMLQLFYRLGGAAVPWSDYAAATKTFATPAAMAATQLGLASMILVSLGLVLFVNRFRPRWLHSVQPGFRWRYALVAFAVAALVVGVFWAVSRIGQPWVIQPEPQFGWYLAVIVLVTPLQAAGEEYFFRGYLMQSISLTAVELKPSGVQPGWRGRAAQWLAKEYPTWAGIIGSALIFALLHPSPNVEAFLYPLAFGILAGVLVVKTGGLEAAIAVHVVNNVISFGYAALSGTMVATYTNRTIGWLDLVVIVASFGLFTFLAIQVARRMNVATRTPAVQFGR